MIRPVVARLARPTSRIGTTIAVVADPHLAVDESGDWKLPERSEERLRTAVADVDRYDVDHVVFVGDLTYDGRRREFDRFDDLVSDLHSSWSAIPGNHDVPKTFDDHDGISPSRFAAKYAPGDLPCEVRVNDVTILCLDTATLPDGSLRDTWGGAVSEVEREWVSNAASAATSPIVFCHHPFSRLPEHEDVHPWDRFTIRRPDPFRETLREADVPLAVSAHHHLLAATRHETVTEILAPATCSFPQAALLLEIDEEGTTVRLLPLATTGALEEAYHAARTGKPIARSILTMATRRLAGLPLIEELPDAPTVARHSGEPSGKG